MVLKLFVRREKLASIWNLIESIDRTGVAVPQTAATLKMVEIRMTRACWTLDSEHLMRRCRLEHRLVPLRLLGGEYRVGRRSWLRCLV